MPRLPSLKNRSRTGGQRVEDDRRGAGRRARPTMDACASACALPAGLVAIDRRRDRVARAHGPVRRRGRGRGRTPAPRPRRQHASAGATTSGGAQTLARQSGRRLAARGAAVGQRRAAPRRAPLGPDRPALRRGRPPRAARPAAAQRGAAWARGRDGALPTDAAPTPPTSATSSRATGRRGRFWRAHPHARRRGWPRSGSSSGTSRTSRGPTTARSPRRATRALARAAIDAGRRANPRARFLIAVDPATAGDADAGRARGWPPWTPPSPACSPRPTASPPIPTPTTAPPRCARWTSLRAALTARGPARCRSG